MRIPMPSLLLKSGQRWLKKICDGVVVVVESRVRRSATSTELARSVLQALAGAQRLQQHASGPAHLHHALAPPRPLPEDVADLLGRLACAARGGRRSGSQRTSAHGRASQAATGWQAGGQVLTKGQVLLEVEGVVAPALQLDAQGKVLGDGVGGEPAAVPAPQAGRSKLEVESLSGAGPS
jgi:hypothetical protein